MYTAIYRYILAHPGIAELTVEDPAEAFEDLRDRNDLKALLAHEQFMAELFGGAVVSADGGRVGRIGRGGAAAMGAAGGGGKKGKMRHGAGGTGGKALGSAGDKAWMEKWRVQLKIARVSIFYEVSLFIVCSTDVLRCAG